MPAHICIYEDSQVERFLPLVYFRPAFDLRCGLTTLREKILRAYPKSEISLFVRPFLASCVRINNPKLRVNESPAGSCLFVNGRIIAPKDIAKKIPLTLTQDVVFVCRETVVAAFLSESGIRKAAESISAGDFESAFSGLPRRDVDVKMASYPWDLVHINGEEIVHDFKAVVGRRKIRRKKREGVYLLGKRGTFIADSAVIKPGVVLDSEQGPVYIGKNVTVLPFTTITGPAGIGDGSIVKPNTTIDANTSIGPVCKVGGEIEESIFQGHSNKQHSGFLGHSYLGSWVNLGADTNTSDLKNDYGRVSVHTGTEEIETGLQFVGLTMGDHSKSAINTMFNTGTVVGVSSNVADSGFPPRYIPSFSWLTSGGAASTYKIDRAIEVARRVMARRNVQLSKEEENLFRAIFDRTKDERRRRGMES